MVRRRHPPARAQGAGEVRRLRRLQQRGPAPLRSHAGRRPDGDAADRRCRSPCFGVGLLQARVVMAGVLRRVHRRLLPAREAPRRTGAWRWWRRRCSLSAPGPSVIEYGRQALGEVPGALFLALGLATWFAGLGAAVAAPADRRRGAAGPGHRHQARLPAGARAGDAGGVDPQPRLLPDAAAVRLPDPRDDLRRDLRPLAAGGAGVAESGQPRREPGRCCGRPPRGRRSSSTRRRRASRCSNCSA